MTQPKDKSSPLYPDIPTDLTTVYLALLKRGPTWSAEKTAETDQLQAKHLAYLRQLAESGSMIMAGPLTDGGHLRGVSIFRVDSLEKAQMLAEADPAVQAGRLVIEIHPWLVSESVLPAQPPQYD